MFISVSSLTLITAGAVHISFLFVYNPYDIFDAFNVFSPTVYA